MAEGYSIDDLDYASGYEKMYGVSDEQMRFLSWHQDNLRRFDVAPTFDSALNEGLKRLEHMRNTLASQGYRPAQERGSLAEAFRVEFAHTTTSLEGNSLTLAETSLVLEQDIPVPDKPLREQAEVLDADRAFAKAKELAATAAPVTEEVVKELHRIVAANLEEADAGQYRWDMRYVTTSRIYPPPPTQVGALMNQLLTTTYTDNPLVTAVIFHLVFEDIHPFGDGNGRTGRVLLNLMLMEAGYAPVAFKADNESARRYYQAIASFVEGIDQRDATPLLKLVMELEETELGRRLL